MTNTWQYRASAIALLTTPISLFLPSPANAADRNCAKMIITRQGGCDELRAAFDLSECEFDSDDSEIAAKVVQCSEDHAILEATLEGKLIRGTLSGKVWAGRQAWEAQGRAEVAAPKKKKKKKVEAATILAPEANPPREAGDRPAPSPSTTPAAPMTSAVPTAPFSPSLVWYGDLRDRVEQVGQESSTPSSYLQNRIRARLGVKAQIAEDTGLDIRLATGTGRTSTNQTLGASATAGTGNNLSNYAILLDRAAFKWNVVPGPTWTVLLSGGRTQNPFYLVGQNDLLFDADLNFDGAHLIQEWKGRVFTPFLVANYTWLNKITNSNAKDTTISSLNAGVKAKAGDVRFMLSGAYHFFKNLSNTAVIDSSASASGNTLSGGRYATGFRVASLGAELVFPVSEQPLTLYVDALKNLAAETLNVGYTAGVKYGKFENPGDIQVCYDYRKLEADAAVAALVDADNFNGGTNGYAHKVCFSYKVRKSWHFAAGYFLGKKFIAANEPRLNRDKFQLDLVFYF